ncbi:hypothetical protein N7467_000860 [Penicillium canescens]|nr:hypothetical protein N7467_000860 [Penicillium canescens]
MRIGILTRLIHNILLLIDASSYYKQHSPVLSTLSIATSKISAVTGYIIAATSTTIVAYVIGEVFAAIDSSDLDLTNDIIIADLTPLEWRGFAGTMLSTPFIINTWFAGKTRSKIVNIASSNAIRRAVRDLTEKQGIEAPHGVVVAPVVEASGPWLDTLKHNLEEIDAFGLILLPFSLKTHADGG